MTRPQNENLNRIHPNIIRAYDDRFSAIDDILKLTIGEPDFNVPENSKQAIIDSVTANDSHYGPSRGTVAVREAIAHFLKDRYQLEYDPEENIVVTVGATEAIYDTICAFVNPGDKVLIPSPTFPLYESDTLLAGADPLLVDTSDDDFLLTPDHLKQVITEYGDAIKVLVLNYPGNPTGRTYSAETLQALAEILDGTNIVVIADEIYSELTYDGPHHSIATYLPEQTLVLNGVSKSHAMTGYRLGFIAGPADLIKGPAQFHQLAVTTNANPVEAAATVALGTPEGHAATIQMRDAYRQRRDYVVTALRELGFTLDEPEGAFYVFPHVPEAYGEDDEHFVIDLAEQAHVATVPGSAFGPGGEGYFRISYACSQETLEAAMQRIEAFLNHLSK
ncbi:aminotransferase [Weissella uvarum]|uniref:aminotransferase class I/II-fold pyridoxal phosphate-dependent enzyme n=1 Tax=Weissella uvarum TaxID=1479233 RepID=UPI0019617C79|nr:aminotransferase class I/II-fold pyridoxal phosphate-dependent enzyme [Weissella uvarum]MBM7617486.1 aminotransferase [Weissella uvarum]MCM0595630.1 aminotransferase class I/II-fold pyridoxal phosphate-dependent enzyme [Weissella uvarum]